MFYGTVFLEHIAGAVTIVVYCYTSQFTQFIAINYFFKTFIPKTFAIRPLQYAYY